MSIQTADGPAPFLFPGLPCVGKMAPVSNAQFSAVIVWHRVVWSCRDSGFRHVEEDLMNNRILSSILVAATLGLGISPAAAQERVSNPVAVFSGLDKITGRITSFDVYIDETVQFGALQVTPKVCYSSAEGQIAKTDAFVQVDEITLQRDIRQIFSGWMFADSPGLNAVEHPVYDVWLKSCKSDSAVPAPEG
ncbi:DUF2155 domain-containing protein [Aurantimonas sp. A3-2-R12]|nr:DUF2155 domain-containing protein [Aurantimonas sp. A3-2-R12]